MFFNETPPEMVADIMGKGIIVSVGELDQAFAGFFQKYAGVNTYVAEEPLSPWQQGAGLIATHLDTYKRTLLNKR